MNCGSPRVVGADMMRYIGRISYYGSCGSSDTNVRRMYGDVCELMYAPNKTHMVHNNFYWKPSGAMYGIISAKCDHSRFLGKHGVSEFE